MSRGRPALLSESIDLAADLVHGSRSWRATGLIRSITINIRSFLALLVALAGATAALASPGSPVGRWQTIDDKTGKARAIVRIYEASGGTLQGDIEKIFYEANESPNATCPRCPEPQRGKPVLGMTILWGLKKPEYGSGREFGGGRILDPSNATVYHCKITLAADGKTLAVRGYVGVTGTLGRTQRWHRLP